MSYKTYYAIKLRQELERDEGVKYEMYEDTEGIKTVGIGYNLEANRLSREIVDAMYNQSIDIAEEGLDDLYPEWRLMEPARQRVLMNMCFNLGKGKLEEFVKMWSAVKTHNWGEAAIQMKASKWYGQVGVRAERLCAMMLTGK